MSFTQGMANWTYGDWRSYSGAAKLQRLASHMQEVTERITENLSAPGRAIGVDPLNMLLKNLEEQYALLGGNTPRTDGGALEKTAWGTGPNEDRGFSCAR